MAAEAMQQPPDVAGDKVDALLSAFQVLTGTLNSWQSLRQVNAVDFVTAFHVTIQVTFYMACRAAIEKRQGQF